jgi:hypothetical protein
VLKRHRSREVGAERLFQQTLRDHGLPALQVPACEGLGPDEIVLEYVEGSPTVVTAPTLDNCRRWGAAIRAMHDIRFASQMGLDDAARPQATTWTDFVAALTAKTIARQRRLATDLPEELLVEAEKRLEALQGFTPSRFVLTHGDLHGNNALVTADGIVLFDKPANVWSAPAIFDVCISARAARMITNGLRRSWKDMGRCRRRKPIGSTTLCCCDRCAAIPARSCRRCARSSNWRCRASPEV